MGNIVQIRRIEPWQRYQVGSGRCQRYSESRSALISISSGMLSSFKNSLATLDRHDDKLYLLLADEVRSNDSEGHLSDMVCQQGGHIFLPTPPAFLFTFSLAKLPI
jgi:hypothetical protein